MKSWQCRDFFYQKKKNKKIKHSKAEYAIVCNTNNKYFSLSVWKTISVKVPNELKIFHFTSKQHYFVPVLANIRYFRSGEFFTYLNHRAQECRVEYWTIFIQIILLNTFINFQGIIMNAIYIHFIMLIFRKLVILFQELP